MLLQLAGAQLLVQEPDAEMVHLHDISLLAGESRGVVNLVEGELVDAWEQQKCHLGVFQALANADQDMLLAAVRDSNRVKSFLDAESQKGQSSDLTIADFQTHVGDPSTLLGTAREKLQSAISRCIATCLKFILVQAARQTHIYGV